MGKYKMIQGYPGDFSDWYPVPNSPDSTITCSKSNLTDFPPYQLFDIEGKSDKAHGKKVLTLILGI